MQSGFDGRFCYGDVLLSFVWNSSLTLADNCKKPKLSTKGSVDKLDDDKNNEVFSTTKQHDFIRTHFHRSTQCDFCGKKVEINVLFYCDENNQISIIHIDMVEGCCPMSGLCDVLP